MYKYSKTTGCFYPNDIEYTELPDDLIEASSDEYAAAMGRPTGALLDVEDDKLFIIPPPPNSYSVWEAGAWHEDPTKKAEYTKQRKAEKLSEINSAYSKSMESIKADVPQDEVLSWTKQEDEARYYLKSIASPSMIEPSVPLLSELAKARGIPLKILAQKVVEKADAFAAFSGRLTGKRQALEDDLHMIDLSSQNAIDEIESITWD